MKIIEGQPAALNDLLPESLTLDPCAPRVRKRALGCGSDGELRKGSGRASGISCQGSQDLLSLLCALHSPCKALLVNEII